MRTLFRYVCVVMMAAFLAACSPSSFSSESSSPESVSYKGLVGKSLSDPVIADWMSTSRCVRSASFQLCKEEGMAFWLDTEQLIQKLFLYFNNDEGFTPYTGELPLGLKYYDTMGAVEYKIRKLETTDNLNAMENAGLPEEGGSPDHRHYWAIYKRYGITIIYNSPSIDEDATIHSIAVNSGSTLLK